MLKPSYFFLFRLPPPASAAAEPEILHGDKLHGEQGACRQREIITKCLKTVCRLFYERARAISKVLRWPVCRISIRQDTFAVWHFPREITFSALTMGHLVWRKARTRILWSVRAKLANIGLKIPHEKEMCARERIKALAFKTFTPSVQGNKKRGKGKEREGGGRRRWRRSEWLHLWNFAKTRAPRDWREVWGKLQSWSSSLVVSERSWFALSTSRTIRRWVSVMRMLENQNWMALRSTQDGPKG